MSNGQGFAEGATLLLWGQASRRFWVRGPHQHEEGVQVAQLASADGAADAHAGALHHLVALHHLQDTLKHQPPEKMRLPGTTHFTGYNRLGHIDATPELMARVFARRQCMHVVRTVLERSSIHSRGQ